MKRSGGREKPNARQEEGFKNLSKRLCDGFKRGQLRTPGSVLLDQRQRVIATNRLGAQGLGVGEGLALVGKSWHEIPRWRFAGRSWRNLSLPRLPVEWSSETGDIRLRSKPTRTVQRVLGYRCWTKCASSTKDGFDKL